MKEQIVISCNRLLWYYVIKEAQGELQLRKGNKMIFASDNDPRVHFYCVDYTDTSGDVNVPDSICYPTLRKYGNFHAFYEDHKDDIEYYDDVDYNSIDFYECDYDDAMIGYDMDDMVCYDEENDMWSHVD